jgi:hypothetical protein
MAGKRDRHAPILPDNRMRANVQVINALHRVREFVGHEAVQVLFGHVFGLIFGWLRGPRPTSQRSSASPRYGTGNALEKIANTGHIGRRRRMASFGECRCIPQPDLQCCGGHAPFQDTGANRLGERAPLLPLRASRLVPSKAGWETYSWTRW